MGFEIQLEKVYYLLELEITSLKCEKDFLLTSLDEIDALIFQKQEEATMKTSDHPTKRLAKQIDAPHPKKPVATQEKMDLEKAKELSVQEGGVDGLSWVLLNSSLNLSSLLLYKPSKVLIHHICHVK